MNETTWTGGCQCGAVRYALSERPGNACICHCRMCQKQFGNFFGAFADVLPDKFHITRGEPGWFDSSDEARRGFCRDCGTPLFYVYQSSQRVAVSIGSLDRHSEIKPQAQYGIEGREPWFADLPALPQTETGEGDNGAGDTPERYEKIRLSCRQHPDHDTAEWPPA
ncbi:GFA family protein [Frigidibacter sp. RF13]|uniref:GFA family protein n=1 Tax=Frigidibacter sp. RF13 TaxID=2997340 RepID=UPI00226F6D9D|nr:GFA family protein [Frigidibacter sp. RF13]MCY1127746.1 GFA family protein [Frigidibacter sp. RF13]